MCEDERANFIYVSDVHQEVSHLHYVYKITFQEISTHVVYNTL